MNASTISASATPAAATRTGRIPTVNSRRNLPLAVLGALLVVSSGLAFAYIYLSASARTSVLAVRRDIAAGSVITEDDVTSVRVALDPRLQAIRANDRSAVVGHVARTTLVAGSLLVESHVSQERAVPAGQTIVALLLKPGQAPEVKPDDDVVVVVTRTADSTGSGTFSARVHSVADPDADSPERVVTLFVAEQDAPAVARAASTGQVSLVLRGTRR